MGIAATATHYLAALLLIQIGILPLWANAGAFVIAFQVSLFGHHRFTFRESNLPLRTSARRLALTALCGFCVSEALLAGLLTWTTLSDSAALAAALGTAAVLTFLMGRYWAFAASKPVFTRHHEQNRA